jgi:hypothetical protein
LTSLSSSDDYWININFKKAKVSKSSLVKNKKVIEKRLDKIIDDPMGILTV